MNSRRLVSNVYETGNQYNDIGFGGKSFWNNSFGENALDGLEQNGFQSFNVQAQQAQQEFGKQNLYEQPQLGNTYQQGYEQDIAQYTNDSYGATQQKEYDFGAGLKQADDIQLNALQANTRRSSSTRTRKAIASPNFDMSLSGMH